MLLVPDPATLRPVPWARDPAASIFLDCLRKDGKPVGTSPRCVLCNVLALFDEKGLAPVVAPELRTQSNFHNKLEQSSTLVVAVITAAT